MNIISQITQRDTIQIAIAEVERLARKPENLPLLKRIRKAEAAEKRRQGLLIQLDRLIKNLSTQ